MERGPTVDDPASSSKLLGKERFMGHDELLACLIQEDSRLTSWDVESCVK